MLGRGIGLALVLLLVVLGITFTTLERTSRAAWIDAERTRREAALEEAAGALAELAARTFEQARVLAAAEPLARLNAARPDERAAAGARVLELLTDLARSPGVRSVTIRPQAGGAPLAGYDRLLGSGEPLGTGSRSPWREADGSPSREDLVLHGTSRAPVAGAPSGRRSTAGDAAASSGEAWLSARASGDGLSVEVTADAGPTLQRCARAAANGAWALVEGDRVLWPPDGVAPPLPAHLVTAAAPRKTVVEGDEVLCAVRVARGAGARWTLLARSPLGELPGGLRGNLLLGAFAAALVLVIAVRGARVTAEAEGLRERGRKERELQAMFDAITDVLVVVDRDLQVVRANRVAVELHGRGLVGGAYRELLAPGASGPEHEVQALREVFARGEPRVFELTEPEGARIWQVAQYPIFAPDLTVSGVVQHARDVTHTRRLQAQLIQSEKLSTLGEVAAGIAHEINNPLGVVSMYAQLLQEEIRSALGEDAPALEQARTIEEQASGVGEIVSNLLRFARKSEGTKAPFDLRDSLRRARTIAAHQKLHATLEVREEVPEGALPQVLGDEGQLAQVLLNLLVNAQHAMQGRGVLGVSLRLREPGDPPPAGRAFGELAEEGGGRRLLVEISDSGEGIPPARLERIFEPFFTSKPAGQGTGLGLSVGFGIVRDHGGRIWVASTPGAGTTFTVDLPVYSA